VSVFNALKTQKSGRATAAMSLGADVRINELLASAKRTNRSLALNTLSAKKSNRLGETVYAHSVLQQQSHLSLLVAQQM
jgi:hypothetical protein